MVFQPLKGGHKSIRDKYIYVSFYDYKQATIADRKLRKTA